MCFQLRPRRGRQRRESRRPDRITDASQSAIGSGGRNSSAGLTGCDMSSSSSTGKSWFPFARCAWNRTKHRIREDPCETAIAAAVEVRAGFDHVGGI